MLRNNPHICSHGELHGIQTLEPGIFRVGALSSDKVVRNRKERVGVNPNAGLFQGVLSKESGTS